MPAWRDRLQTFGQLIACAASAPPAPSLDSNIPESDLVWLRSKKIDSALFLYSSAALREHPWQRLYDAIWKTQAKGLEELLEVFGGYGIAPILLKGGDAVSRYFDGKGFGLFNDIDLLVRRSELQDVRAAFFQLGYRQACFDQDKFALSDRDVRDIASIEMAHYELAPFCKLIPLQLSPAELEIARQMNGHPVWVKDNQVYAAVEFDVHFQVASDVECAKLFERARPSLFENAFSLSTADAIWFTTIRYYTEISLHGKESLRDLFYIAPVLEREEIDWDIVLQEVLELENAPALYYPLAFLGNYLKQGAPQEVLARLDPVKNARARDCGWQLGKLFGFVEPCPVQHQP